MDTYQDEFKETLHVKLLDGPWLRHHCHQAIQQNCGEYTDAISLTKRAGEPRSLTATLGPSSVAAVRPQRHSTFV
jgi:hypothetical protein